MNLNLNVEQEINLIKVLINKYLNMFKIPCSFTVVWTSGKMIKYICKLHWLHFSFTGKNIRFIEK